MPRRPSSECGDELWERTDATIALSAAERKYLQDARSVCRRDDIETVSCGRALGATYTEPIDLSTSTHETITHDSID